MTPTKNKAKPNLEEYLKKCQTECGDRLLDPSFFAQNDLQQNALRVEILRDMTPRCGRKMPEHWPQAVKDKGWGIWIFSGGTAEVFGHCSLSDCPLRGFFLEKAPYKHIRMEAKQC